MWQIPQVYLLTLSQNRVGCHHISSIGQHSLSVHFLQSNQTLVGVSNKIVVRETYCCFLLALPPCVRKTLIPFITIVPMVRSIAVIPMVSWMFVRRTPAVLIP